MLKRAGEGQLSGNPASTPARMIRSFASIKRGLAFRVDDAMLRAFEPGLNTNVVANAAFASSCRPSR